MSDFEKNSPQPEPQKPEPQAATPHLTLHPDEEPPFPGDPFASPQPPRAPNPPHPEEPQTQYAPPQYVPPQYGQGQYSAPQYGAPQSAAPQYTQQGYYQAPYAPPPAGYVQKSRLAAGLLAVMLGALGVHNFYLGFTSRGVVQLVVTLVGGLFTCGLASLAMVVWGFVEGVLLLSASPSRMYDGRGVLLRD